MKYFLIPQMSPMDWLMILMVSFISLMLLIFSMNCFMKDYYLNMYIMEEKYMFWILKW